MTVLSDAPAREPVTGAGDPPRTVTKVAAAVAIVCGSASFFWTRSEMWLDEALAVNVARLPLGELRAALERDGAPPLYYALLHAWTGVLGEGNLAARSLSGVFALLALGAIWWCARRMIGARGAWIAVVVTAVNPYAVRYATEARMYMLEILLVSCGILAVWRARERPTPVRLAAVALVAALLVYTQYWAFYLVGTTGFALLVVAWRDREARRAALAVAVAVAAGTATFAAWLPTFLSQRAHTGTPWGEPVLPGLPIGETFLAFAGGETHEGWLLLLLLVPLTVLGLLGRALDERHVVLEPTVVPPARWPAAIGGATLVVGTVGSYVADQAFEPRYSAIVFPFFVLLVARGITTLADRRVRAGVLAVVVGLGLVGAARNVAEAQRTQAGQVGSVLRAEARPGDVVAYCPDQLGPAVHRVAPAGLDHVTYPDLGDARFVDWVDYQARVDAADPDAFVAAVLALAGDRTVWYVTGPGYATHRGACEAMIGSLAAPRDHVVHVHPDEAYFEKPGLHEFRVRVP